MGGVWQETLSSLYFSNIIMNPLDFYWAKKHAHKVHLLRMRQAHKPAVTYQAFCNRLKKGWPLEKAIYTPAYTKKRPHRVNMKKKSWRHNIIYSIKNLFRF